MHIIRKGLRATNETAFPTNFDVLPFSSEFFKVMNFTH